MGEVSEVMTEKWFAGSGEMASLMRSRFACAEGNTDESQTPLGAIETWSPSLRASISILLASPCPMYLAWGENFIQFYNDAYAPLLGSTKHPALGQSASECFCEQWDSIGLIFEQVMREGKAIVLENQRLLDRAGSVEECRFTFSYSPIPDESGQVGGVLVTVNETSQRILNQSPPQQAVDAALQRSEERARLAVEIAQLGTWRYDPTTDLIELDERMREIWGESEDAIALPLARALERIHPNDRERVASAVENALDPESSGVYEIDYRIVWNEGTERWISANGQATFAQTGAVRQVVELLGTALDITDRKQAVSTLRHSEQRYRTLFEAIDQAFCVCELIWDEMGTPQDHRILEINSAFERLTGLKQVVGKVGSELISTLEPFWLETYARVVRTGESARFESHIQGLDGWFDVYVAAIDAPESKQFAIVFQNITERKRTEEIVQRTARLDAFRAALADALRSLTDPIEIQATASRVLGESLGASRVIYIEVLPGDQEVIVHKNYTNGVTELSGLYRLEDFGRNLTADHRSGRTAIVPNVATYPKYTPDETARYHSIQIAAHIDVPLIKDQQFVALLAVHQASPRQWTEDEVKQVEETAEQTWAAVERARAEVALRQSEERTRNILESIHEAFFALNENWQFTYVNPSAEALLDRAPGDLVGKNIWEEYPGLAANELAQIYRNAMHDRLAGSLTAFYPDHDRWYDVRAYPAPTGIAVYFRNVTDQIQVDEALRQSESRFRRIFECNMVPIAVWTVAGGITQANDALLDMIGYTRAELEAGQINWQALTPPEYRSLDEIALNEVAMKGVSVPYEKVYVCKDGRRIPILIGAASFLDDDTSGIFFAIDLTDRKQAKAALQESEERYRTLFESIDQGFCLLEVLFDANDKAYDYRYLEINEAFEQQSGLTNVVGKTIRELVPNLEPQWGECYEQVVKLRESVRFEADIASMSRVFDVYAVPSGAPGQNLVSVLFSDITDRKRIEAELRASEERFRNMADNAPMMVWVTDPTGYCTYLSQSWYDFTGQTEETGLGFGWLDAAHPDDRKHSEAVFLAANDRQEGFQLEYRLRHRDGHYRMCIDAANPRFGANGEFEGYIGSVIDIDDRKQAEAIIATDLENTRLLRDLSARLINEDEIQVLYDEIMATAIALTKADAGTVQMLDNATQDLLLLAAQGFDRTITDHFYRVNASSNTSCGIALTRGTRTLIDFDVPGDDPDGSLQMHVNAGYLSAQSTPLISRSGEVIGMVSTHWRTHYRPSDRELRFLDLLTRQAADLIERRQTEAALRDSEELKQSILESSKDCIKVLTLNAEIVYVNTGGLRLLEVDDPTLMLNAHWLDFWQGEARENAESAIAAAKAGNTGQFQGYRPTHQGTPKWWDILITPVRDSAGQVTQLLVVSRDITKQKQAETERERLLAQEQAAREEAERANRIKDEFLAVLSHELRSPLNPILGWTRLLQNGKLDEARQAEALRTIERNAKLQSQLIEDLLDISRIMQGKLSLTVTPVNLPFVISAAVETVRLAAEAKHIQITLDLDPSVDSISGDAARLQQVVWNLLTNAVKFTPNSGQVTVELRQLDGLAQIRVIDTGKGINPPFLPHVFEYFRQEDGSTTRKFGGLGLGLAIVRQIVEMHGGTVRAESQGEGQGATFIVQLPTMQQAALISSEPTHSQTDIEVPLAGIQILLVDDEPDTREFQTFLLEQNGATVTAVASGLEALQALELFVPNLLVSDVGMPEMNGYMLLQQIRSRPPSQGGTIPAIALTAYAGELNQQQAIQAGFQRHLAKPVDSERLIAIVTELVASV